MTRAAAISLACRLPPGAPNPGEATRPRTSPGVAFGMTGVAR
jgi:hypothetical protein